MTDKPTGVFVRLPLSDAQRMTANEAPYKKDRKGSALEASILSIGTPVTNEELKVVDYSAYEPEYHSEGMGCGLEDRGIHDRYEAMGYGWDQALDRACSEFPEAVLLSDALAKLAEKDAEIVRLRQCLEKAHLSAVLGDVDPSADLECCREHIEEALKGPEA